LIAAGAGEMGIAVSHAQIQALACHANELLTWNRKINLTRISAPAEMAVKHYVDSLAGVPHVPDGAAILDIGTGGGFPGIPLAVVARPRSILMIDRVGKKIRFLQHAIRLLGLPNAEARHIRAQDLKTQAGYANSFDRVLCRALTDIEQIIALAFPLLKPGGMVVALKGRAARTEEELRRLTDAGAQSTEMADIRSVPYRLPILNLERSLLLIRKHPVKEPKSGL
jgi:16S rRNA (guanine527-N7)-methyltransferase